jgi:hypothetical protein
MQFRKGEDVQAMQQTLWIITAVSVSDTYGRTITWTSVIAAPCMVSAMASAFMSAVNDWTLPLAQVTVAKHRAFN